MHPLSQSVSIQLEPAQEREPALAQEQVLVPAEPEQGPELAPALGWVMVLAQEPEQQHQAVS
jgi:hypothetical protein